MTKTRRPAKSGVLSQEDEALWQEISKSVAPFRKRERVHKAVEMPPVGRPLPNREDKSKTLAGVQRPPEVPAPSGPARDHTKRPPAVAELDRRRARKIAGGHVEIEARLDLHGMYQSEAHARLRAFIMGCYGRGQRHVLIVTGKGTPTDDQQSYELDGRRDRGVLRRTVPIWLSESDLRSVVVSFTTAHVRHGGEGALYVHLRNPERRGRRHK